MNKYFVYDPNGDGYYEFETEAQAIKEANDCLDNYLDDGWDEEVVNVTCGKVTHRATQTDFIERPPSQELDDDGCDLDGDHWKDEWDHKCNYKMKAIR